MPKFTDDDIRRTDIPADAFGLLHDICYDYHDRRGYRERAQQILSSTAKHPTCTFVWRGHDKVNCDDHCTDDTCQCTCHGAIPVALEKFSDGIPGGTRLADKLDPFVEALRADTRQTKRIAKMMSKAAATVDRKRKRDA